jgi:DNA-binding transcriptional regulator GbsR (MarR family)
MTESQELQTSLPEAVQQFVLHWGNLGERWGVNRSVGQIHALLYASERPLTAEEIAETLGMARSNVSNSLRELQSWGIIRGVSVMGDRRTFYEAETDLWTIVTRIATGRKSRELDPAAVALRQCIEGVQGDRALSPVVARRLKTMLDFIERTSHWYEQMSKLSRSQIAMILKLGGGIVRLLERNKASRGTVEG